MGEIDELVSDLLEFLNKIENLNQEDRRKLLVPIVEKYRLTKNNDLIVTYSDFQLMLSYAKTQYSTLPFPVKIGDRELSTGEVANYCMFLAVVAFLNKNEALKRLPEFKRGR